MYTAYKEIQHRVSFSKPKNFLFIIGDSSYIHMDFPFSIESMRTLVFCYVQMRNKKKYFVAVIALFFSMFIFVWHAYHSVWVQPTRS